MSDVSGTRSLFGVALVAAGLWLADDFSRWNATNKDFWVCDSRALSAEMDPKLLEWALPASRLNEHDQVDELINRCMLDKGYDYVPDGWERCPTEKLAACYHMPAPLTKIYRLFTER